MLKSNTAGNTSEFIFLDFLPEFGGRESFRACSKMNYTHNVSTIKATEQKTNEV